tara:strand:+ start:1624 stop:2622 length:999 start_codon:yes stop_codon:yes gene_type:complete
MVRKVSKKSTKSKSTKSKSTKSKSTKSKSTKKRNTIKKSNSQASCPIQLNKHVSSKKCAPNKNNSPCSCFDREGLIKIINAWNQNHPDQVIDFNTNTSNTELWNNIHQKLKSKCNKEWCWIQQEFVKRTQDEELLEYTFRPQMPSKWKENKYEWLNTLDIEGVMKQYEDIYDNFMFIGPVPMDFDAKLSMGNCVIDELCNIKLSQLLKDDIYHLGIIFNLDYHDKPGSHWVAMFSDFNKNEIYYFDSYGIKPSPEVKRLMKRLKKQGKGMDRDIKLYYNHIRHQYKNSECGVYCINFIVELLKGRTFKSVIKNIIRDEKMNRKRTKYFIKSF